MYFFVENWILYKMVKMTSRHHQYYLNKKFWKKNLQQKFSQMLHIKCILYNFVVNFHLLSDKFIYKPSLEYNNYFLTKIKKYKNETALQVEPSIEDQVVIKQGVIGSSSGLYQCRSWSM